MTLNERALILAARRLPIGKKVTIRHGDRTTAAQVVGKPYFGPFGNVVISTTAGLYLASQLS